jgi:hypothetical protein
MPNDGLRLLAASIRHSIGLPVGAAVLLAGCRDNAHAPLARPEPEPTETGQLDSLDLVYVCGNKFLVTNATRSVVTVTYRVAGTNEWGSRTLREEPGEEPGFSETELETVERGAVDLYLNGARVARHLRRRLPRSSRSA